MALAAIGFYLLQRSVSPPANIDGKAPTHRVFAATQRAARSAPALQKRAARSASALQKCAARSTPPSQERAVRSAAVFQARPIHGRFSPFRLRRLLAFSSLALTRETHHAQ